MAKICDGSSRAMIYQTNSNADVNKTETIKAYNSKPNSTELRIPLTITGVTVSLQISATYFNESGSLQQSQSSRLPVRGFAITPDRYHLAWNASGKHYILSL